MVRDVKIILQGFRKVAWVTDTVQGQWVQQKDRVFSREVQLQTESNQENECGVRCWPFRMALDAHMPETIDSLPSSYIRYFLTAEICTGFWRRVHRAVRTVRIIKAPSFWAEDTVFQELSTDIWPNKISYQISSQQLHQVHEKEMAVHFQLTPLKHGMDIDNIHLDLVQTELLIATKGGRPWRADRSSTTLASAVQPVPPHCKDGFAIDRGGRFNEAEMRDESLRFTLKLPIDLAGRRRVQSVEDDKIKIRHVLKVCVDLLNPEGHLSKLMVDFHPRFCVSVDSMETMSGQCSGSDGTTTPPLYGDHVFDEVLEADEDERIGLPEYEDGDGLRTAAHS